MDYGTGYLLKGNEQQSFDKLNFNNYSNELKNLSLIYEKDAQSGFSNKINGYSTGKFRIIKLIFSDEISYLTTNKLSDNRDHTSGAESYHSGFTFGGFLDNKNSSSIDKLIFTTESNNLLNSKISRQEKSTSACTNLREGSYIYVKDSVNRLSYLTDEIEIVHSAHENYATCSFEDIDHGYFCGGFTTVQNIHQFDFNKQSFNNFKSKLIQTNRQHSIGISNRYEGYVAGSNNADNTIEKINFKKEQTEIINSILSNSKTKGHGFEYLPWQR